MSNRGRKGNALIEFTLVGIPIIFVLISIFEIARGMWLYDTLAHAVKEGVRYAVVHGNNCGIPPNSCTVRIQDVARRIAYTGVGLIPTDLQDVTFVSRSRSLTYATLDAALNDAATYWPAAAPGSPAEAGGERFMEIEISARYPFRSAISMLWPGAGPGIIFGTFLLPASSKEWIEY